MASSNVAWKTWIYKPWIRFLSGGFLKAVPWCSGHSLTGPLQISTPSRFAPRTKLMLRSGSQRLQLVNRPFRFRQAWSTRAGYLCCCQILSLTLWFLQQQKCPPPAGQVSQKRGLEIANVTHKLLVSLRYITYIYPLSQNKLSLFPNLIKSNLVDTDAEGIIKVSLLTGCPY